MREVFLESRLTSLLAAVPRERSGLAYAAGYAGLLSLFRYSFAPLTMSGWRPASMLGWGFVLFFSLLAPLALILSFVAAFSLERSPERSGSLPLLVGFLLGWQGILTTLFMVYKVWNWFGSLG